MERVVIDCTATGYTVTRFTDTRKGRDGELLATVCGGNLGKALAVKVAITAAEIGMIDAIHVNSLDGLTTTFTLDQIRRY